MFDDFYQVFLADTPESKDIHYTIRHEVYCQEKGFEDESPLKQERDEYDQHAIHFIARDKTTGQWVAALRVAPRDGRSLPLEHHCPLNEEIVDTPSHRVAEMSRTCILKDVRKLASSHADTEENNRRSQQSILWGLMYASLVYSEKHDIKKCYTLSPLAMERILNRAGYNTQRVSDVYNFKGRRVVLAMLPSVVRNCAIWQKGFGNGYSLYSEMESVKL